LLKITYRYKIKPEKIQERNINLASTENENDRENYTFRRKLNMASQRKFPFHNMKMTEKFTDTIREN